MELPWIEKYRPRCLSQMVGNEEILDRLEIISRTGNVPHMVLTGAPGLGKTTSALCLAHQLLGSKYSEAVLEMNASDERGIEAVRQNIKAFAQKKVVLAPGKHKLVVLDEADSMTAGAQQALRRIMEIYASTTRFIFACNYSNKLIEPIQSRCIILRFSLPEDGQMLKKLVEICDREHVQSTPEGMEMLLFSAHGDFRQAINSLQSTHVGFGVVSVENVVKIVNKPHPARARQMLEHCSKGELDASFQVLLELWKQGYAPQDIISTLFRVAKTASSFGEKMQLEMIREIGLAHIRAVEGLKSLLQIGGLLSRLCQLVVPFETWQVKVE